MAGNGDKSTALWVLTQLRDAGYEALFAGGCVRDMLMGLASNDYDIATNATPQQVQAAFPKVLMVGAKFGVAMVIKSARTVEVATFRNDGSYSDGRRPDGVEYSSAREDALRRDFTINGMFYDPLADEVIDYVGGREDLKKGIIRTIGQPEKRFGEDFLRMLRAVRFSVRFDFEIESQTAAAVRKLCANIVKISGERICDELTRMLTGPNAVVALRLLEELGLAQQILPELFKEDDGLWQQAVVRMENVRQLDEMGMMGMLLCDLPTAAVRKIIRRWGASNSWRRTIEFMSENRDGWRSVLDGRLCAFKRFIADPAWECLFELWRTRERIETGKTGMCDRISAGAAKIEPAQIAPQPLVTGDDLGKSGVKPGKDMGAILNEIYDMQLDGDITSREDALKEAMKIFNSRNHSATRS
jgi:poly(A) polymerase